MWLIRKIGSLLNEDSVKLDRKRRKLKHQVNKKYKKFTRETEKLLNLIHDEGNFVEGN